MANDTTPLMLITNVGLAAASRALPQGPYIHIVKFEIGSAYGYTPDVNQTQLRGNILYGGDPNPANWAKPSDYRSIGDNTLNIILEIPPEAGPWEFGEVGIFAEDENHDPYLFAIAVFQSPQTKFSSLGTNVVSSYTLNCLLKLQQSVAIFQIDTATAHPYVLDIYQWSDVYPPSLSANPDIPIYNVKEPNSRSGAGSLLITTSDGTRSLTYGAYEEIWSGENYAPFVVQAASSSYIEVAKTQYTTQRFAAFSGTTFNRAWLVQTHAGFWRSVSSLVENGNNYRFNLNVTNDGVYNNYPLPVVPQIGEEVRIYTDHWEGRSMLYRQIVDPPPPPSLALPGSPGLATAGHGLNVDSAGILGAYGLLHQPSQGTGRFLTGGDLNQMDLDSGLYTVDWNQGHPANGPYDQGFPETSGVSFHLMQICPERGQGTNGGSITQLYMPLGQGPGGQSIYWRQCMTGTWYPWSQVVVAGSGSGSSVTAMAGTPTGTGSVVQLTLPIPTAGTWQILAWAHNMCSIYQSGVNLLINGVLVDSNINYGDSDGIGFNTLYGVYSGFQTNGPVSIPVVANFGNSQGANSGDQKLTVLAVRS